MMSGSCWNDWDPLEEVVLGRIVNTPKSRTHDEDQFMPFPPGESIVSSSEMSREEAAEQTDDHHVRLPGLWGTQETWMSPETKQPLRTVSGDAKEDFERRFKSDHRQLLRDIRGKVRAHKEQRKVKAAALAAEQKEGRHLDAWSETSEDTLRRYGCV
jgi:hypothetical protein